mmetsp:Transcript_4000/g.6057  ORF Transcript_4000/g.6057 Transcript_4000/m.6057 type:complete len:275 (+) Transcript_4000:24-848(+)
MDAQKKLNEILNKPGNRVCADCDTRNPRWASINLGVFICIRCSGHHRNLGVHISKIKSVTLDKWTPEMLNIFDKLDNEKANAYWESKKPSNVQKPSESTPSYSIERFLREKYERKSWAPQGVTDPVQKILKGETEPKPSPPVKKVEPKAPEVNLLDMEFEAPSPAFASSNSTSNTSQLTSPPQFTSPQFTNPQFVSPPQPPAVSFPPINTQPEVKQEDERQKKIQQVMAMYNQPQQFMQQPPTQQFQPLGAVAAQNFFASRQNPPYQQGYWPTF